MLEISPLVRCVRSYSIRNIFTASSVTGHFFSLMIAGQFCAWSDSFAQVDPGVSQEVTPQLAQVLSSHDPKICHGLLRYQNPQSTTSETTATWGTPNETGCPKNYAIPGNAGVSGPRTGPAERIFIFENCCELPSVDILTTEVAETFDQCPPDFIATSAQAKFRNLGEGPWIAMTKTDRFTLVCTKINTTRYQLGPAQEGIYWGFGASFWRQPKWLARRDIPAAFRDAIGRTGKYTWSDQGCVGYPFGALLTGKQGKRCSELTFRQLQFRGLPGDPPPGTPVPLFPDCEKIDSAYVEQPMCVRGNER